MTWEMWNNNKSTSNLVAPSPSAESSWDTPPRAETLPVRWKHSRFPVRGIAYTEVLLSSIILAVLVVSAMKLFANLGRSRQSVVQNDAANYLALQMIEEIKQQNYNDRNEPTNFGVESGEDTGPGRCLFDDVDDYQGWSASPPQDQNGNELDPYSDYTRTVEVNYVAADDFTQKKGSDEGFKEVKITISRENAQGADEIQEQQIYVIADAPGVVQR